MPTQSDNKTEPTPICGKCGAPLQKAGYIDDHISIGKIWGYGSQFDGETHNFDVCAACYSEWIESFLNNPREQTAEDFR
ncbi:MAG: hypothetical protein LBU36_00520 [Clostridiales bacterium]|nr:hypothetical protein [Clostridiales bacterium]